MATPVEQLDEARAAQHKLLTGVLPRVVVDQNGERVEYTSANAGALAAYIARLEKLVDPCKVSGPALVWL